MAGERMQETRDNIDYGRLDVSSLFVRLTSYVDIPATRAKSAPSFEAHQVKCQAGHPWLFIAQRYISFSYCFANSFRGTVDMFSCLKSSPNPVYYRTHFLASDTLLNNVQAGQSQTHENCPVRDQWELCTNNVLEDIAQ